MPNKRNIFKSISYSFIALVLFGTLSALSLSTLEWLDNKIKQTEINFKQDKESEKSEEKSEFELEETLLNSNDLEHTLKLCYSEIYFAQHNASLNDGLTSHITPPPRSC